MVGIVIVSHSQKLAESVVELAALMAPKAPMAAAGGLEDGGFGTSFEKIEAAVRSVCSPDGVVILADLGSAVMTAEMVVELFEGEKVAMADAPLVEGAVVAAIDSVGNVSFDEMMEHLKRVGKTKKF